MAGIFKSLDKSDVRITPFRTHKLWSENLSYTKIELTGSVPNTTPFLDLQVPYATRIYPTYPVAPHYYINDSEIISYLEVDNDTFSIAFRSSTATSFTNTPFIANRYLTGILDVTDTSGPSRVITINSNNSTNQTEINQLDFELTSPIGSPYSIPISGSYINRLDYFPFDDLSPLNNLSMILVSHNMSGSYGGLIGITVDPNNKNYIEEFNIAYDDPGIPFYSRGDYYFAIPSSENQHRILTVYKRDGVLTSSNIDLQPLPASSSYSTQVALGGVGDHATTGVVDVVAAHRYAFFTLKGQNSVYASSFDIPLMNNLNMGNTKIARLLVNRDSIRYYADSDRVRHWAMQDNYSNVVAVLEEGTILTNLKMESPSGQFTYDIIDARQYVGAGSLVTNATINKNIDVISSGSASLLYVWVEPITKGKSSMFVVNLDTEEIYDPIHTGFLSNTDQPLFGSQQNISTMISADNRTTSVLGITQNKAEINPTTGITSRYLYKFDVQ